MSNYEAKVHSDGEDRQVVASGGSFDVESGGEIDIESGGALKLAGTDYVAHLANRMVATGSLTADASSPYVAFSVQNPLGVAAYATLVCVDVTTAVTGAATLDVGVANDATTSNDTLIDGADIGTAAIFVNNRDNAGTNGLGVIKVGASQYINGVGSGDLSGVVGTYLVEFVKAG